MSERYDVIIYELATGEVASIIGRDMRAWDGTGSRRNTAEMRMQTGMERINDRYECVMVRAGSCKEGDRITPKEVA